jgi:hypothetical protein
MTEELYKLENKMVKKKQLAEKWIVIDSDDHIFYYPNFTTALKHPGSRVSIMTEEYYETAYKEINKKY